MNIRSTKREDIPALQAVLDATGLFPSEMLPEMIAGFLDADAPEAIWLTCEIDGQPVALCHAIPEELADRTWNMLAIGVLPGLQGRGCGRALLRQLEHVLRARDQRILIVDTSGTAEFAPARAFYQRNGYAQEARIRDFWAEGDDKIVFRKSLK